MMARRRPRPYEVVRWMKVVDKARLKRARLRKHYTQRELAVLVKTSQATISYLEGGTMRTLSEKLALAIARRLDCDWEDLFVAEEAPRVSGLANGAHTKQQVPA